ncbi:unnamed protein product [marine sediment metagenome]|uniref:Uncharacterized protein n=1 Tax=marine sediment metagenome TaxID=412755 RepID=X0YUY2_9ZZZZ
MKTQVELQKLQTILVAQAELIDGLTQRLDVLTRAHDAFFDVVAADLGYKPVLVYDDWLIHPFPGSPRKPAFDVTPEMSVVIREAAPCRPPKPTKKAKRP